MVTNNIKNYGVLLVVAIMYWLLLLPPYIYFINPLMLTPAVISFCQGIYTVYFLYKIISAMLYNDPTKVLAKMNILYYVGVILYVLPAIKISLNDILYNGSTNYLPLILGITFMITLELTTKRSRGVLQAEEIPMVSQPKEVLEDNA